MACFFMETALKISGYADKEMRNSLIFARYFEMNCRLFSMANSNFLFQDANLKEIQKDTKEGSG